MKKLVNKKMTEDKKKNIFKSLITNKEIYDFIKKEQLTLEIASKYLSEFLIFQEKPDKYDLAYEYNQVVLKEHKHVINEGVYYLDDFYFSQNKNLELIDYKQNPTKAKVVKDFLQNPRQGLFLISSNGVGKTTLLIALANTKYQLSGAKTLFVFWPDFIEKTKRFQEDNIYYINKVKNASSLIIDDLGQESITAWSRDDILHPIITYRLEKKLPTYITSNYLLEELQNIYTFRSAESKKTKSIITKISTLTKVYQLQGEDLRKKELNGSSST